MEKINIFDFVIMKKAIEETIKEYEAEGKDAKFMKEMLAKY